jgi:hypothetical protein
MKLLKRGDEVAVLPLNGSPPCDVLGVAIVAYVGLNLIEVADGRIFFTSDGRSLHGEHDGWIVPATEEHSSVLKVKAR